MKTIGIFEAKTHLSGLCDEVARNQIPVLLQRRGKPLVMITPIAADILQENTGILDSWEAWEKNHQEEGSEDFPEVWPLRQNKPQPPVLD